MERNIRKMTPYDLVGVPKLGKLGRVLVVAVAVSLKGKKGPRPRLKKECGGLYIHTSPVNR
jgi:hypothetical protein